MKKKGIVLLPLIAVVAGSGCGSDSATTAATSDSTVASTSVKLAGAMSVTSSSSSSRLARNASSLRGGELIEAQPVASAAVDVSTLTMSCISLSVPPTAGSGTFDSDGNFSVTIEDAKGKKVACYILDSDEEVLGSMVFKDSNSKSMSGNAKKSDSTAFDSTDLNLGNIAFDLDSGQAIVDMTTVVANDGAAVVAAASSVEGFDPTGSWVITTIPADELSDAEKAQKYRNPCAESEMQGDNDCNGPPDGYPLYIKRALGVAADGSNGYGLMLWDSEDAFEACGSTLGESYASLEEKTGIDFSASGLSEGSFVYASSVTIDSVTSTITDGWKLSSARSSYGRQDCGPAEYNGQQGWKCIDSSGNYQIGIGGGCTNTATNVAVQPDDWSGINSCTNAQTASGLYTSTCTGTATVDGDSVNVSCTHTYGVFNSSDVAIDPSLFDWNSVGTLATQNQLCSTIAAPSGSTQSVVDKYLLAQLQCYSDAYYQAERALVQGGYCAKDIRTDWTATDPDAFIDERDVPRQLIFANTIEYSSDGLTATLYDEDEYYGGVRVETSGGGENWVSCRVLDSGSITFTKLSDTKLKVIYAGTLKNLSKDKPACVANFGSSGSLEEKFIFYMNKQ